MTYKDIKHNEEVNELLKKGNQNLGLLGYTEHSQAHCVRVAETAAHILKKFGYPEHDIELARIAGYMHDIGNAINRSRHAEYGGLLANEILKQYDLSVPDRITIVSAISNHDESTGGAVDPISQHSSSATRLMCAAAVCGKSPKHPSTSMTGSTMRSQTRP